MGFKKTYMTEGLKVIVDEVKRRLEGLGGDPVIQIQTPFGGGKTHALIALYHNAKHWNVKRVVLSGTSMSPSETLWGTVEKQLTGDIADLTGNIAPGREALRKLLERNQPVLILIDELLEYITKTAGVQIKDTTLAAQTMAFMQELTEVAGTLEKVSVIVTLPSKVLEQYDKNAERMFNQLQKVSGRVERIYSPVREYEIAQVIRRRLFSHVDLKKVEENVNQVLEYLEKEAILPIGMEVSDYRTKFIDSYPFMPEVMETLYHRWGSIPTFQRTRGVLRLLSLIIHSLKDYKIPYISLADFDLSDDTIRRELVKYIGNEYDSVLSADVTGSGSGSKKIDESLGKSFSGLKIGTRAATSIFMYSFSGGVERGCHLAEIIRAATTTDNPSSVVAEAVDQLKSNLFFIQNVDDKYLFSNNPNLNRIVLTKIENIKNSELIDFENELLRKLIGGGGRLKVYLWPEIAKDIPDIPDLKIVVIRYKNEHIMKDIIETKGESPRIYRNTIFFLTSLEVEKPSFLEVIKRRIAYEHIDADKTLNLTDKLRAEEEILENISPIVIKERYLENKDNLEVRQIYESMLKTPGQSRVTSPAIIEAAVKNGVKQGKFGLGEIDNTGKVVCRFFQQDISLSIDDMELILSDKLCTSQLQTGISGVQEQQPMDQIKMSEPSLQPLSFGDIPSETLLQLGIELESS